MQNKKKPQFTPKRAKNTHKTSWEGVSSWYDKAVGHDGHYYHQQVILPKLSHMLSFTVGMQGSLLDLACGQGILARHIPESLSYVGVDISPSLLSAAREKTARPHCEFILSDITKPLALTKKDFDFCTIILALQNLEHPLYAFKNAAKHLGPQGKLLLVMNHPCFRIPKESSWDITPNGEIQYRRIDRYYSDLKIPIQSKPSLGSRSPVTFSFHHPLSTWTLWLKEAGFVIEWIEEWCSDKVSTGKHALREDQSRHEIPLFLALRAKKNIS